eukprot:Nk52_evm10s96 gene=Nk52_evmTU10s96
MAQGFGFHLSEPNHRWLRFACVMTVLSIPALTPFRGMNMFYSIFLILCIVSHMPRTFGASFAMYLNVAGGCAMGALLIAPFGALWPNKYFLIAMYFLIVTAASSIRPFGAGVTMTFFHFVRIGVSMPILGLLDCQLGFSKKNAVYGEMCENESFHSIFFMSACAELVAYMPLLGLILYCEQRFWSPKSATVAFEKKLLLVNEKLSDLMEKISRLGISQQSGAGEGDWKDLFEKIENLKMEATSLSALEPSLYLEHIMLYRDKHYESLIGAKNALRDVVTNLVFIVAVESAAMKVDDSESVSPMALTKLRPLFELSRRVLNRLDSILESTRGPLLRSHGVEQAATVGQKTAEEAEQSLSLKDLCDELSRAVIMLTAHSLCYWIVDQCSLSSPGNSRRSSEVGPSSNTAENLLLLKKSLRAEKPKQTRSEFLRSWVKWFAHHQHYNLKDRVVQSMKVAVPLVILLVIYAIDPQAYSGCGWMALLHSGAYFSILFSVSSVSAFEVVTVGAVVYKSALRAFGVILGGLLSMIVNYTLSNNAYAVALGAFMNFFLVIYFYDHWVYTYAALYWGITFITVGIVYTQVVTVTPYNASLKALLVIIGTLFAIAVNLLFVPTYASDTSYGLVKEIFETIGSYLEWICHTVASSGKVNSTDLEYRIDRLIDLRNQLKLTLGQVAHEQNILRRYSFQLPYYNQVLQLVNRMMNHLIFMLKCLRHDFSEDQELQESYFRQLSPSLLGLSVETSAYMHSMAKEIEESHSLPEQKLGYSVLLNKNSDALYETYRQLRSVHRENLFRIAKSEESESESKHKARRNLLDPKFNIVAFNALMISLMAFCDRVRDLEELA